MKFACKHNVTSIPFAGSRWPSLLDAVERLSTRIIGATEARVHRKNRQARISAGSHPPSISAFQRSGLRHRLATVLPGPVLASLAILFGFLIPAVESRAQGLAADRAALEVLYNATGGANWTNNTNWLSTTEPVGNWHGVTVTNERVTGLLLSNNELSGTIPTQLGNLSNLRTLQLSNNQLTGTIPTELGNLANLTRLDLYRNQLTGSIPTQLGNLANLTSLNLGINQLTGSIPTQLGNLANLTSLNLEGNQLTGSIPTQLGNLSNLEILKFARNRLTGPIPSSLGNLANLQWLWLTSNQLTGTVPAALGNLANLEMLRLGANRLTGPLPQSLTNLESLTIFSFNNGTTGLCAPTDSAFQDWLQAIPNRDNGPNCSADNYSIPARTPLTYPKAGSVLDELIARFESGEITAEDAASEAPLHRGDAVGVTIHLQSGNVSAMVTFLQNNGVTPRNQGEDYVEAFVPIRLLGPVSQQTGVLRMRMIQPPEPDQMAVPGNGPAVHGSPAWNQAGYTGQGIKVGVIDAGFDGLEDLLGTELPATVQAMCFDSDFDEPTSNLSDCETNIHGTAVAESVLDIAPDVELYIANPASAGDLHDAVAWMANPDQGVEVINYSMSNKFLGPGDGTSPFDDSPLKAVVKAVDNGIVWVNSAGNAAQQTWFKRAPFSFSSNDLVHFNGSDSTNRVSLRKDQVIRVQLRWDDNWTTGATSDLGIHIGNSSTGAIIKGANDIQSGNLGEIPFEFLWFVAPSDGQYDLLVERFSGAVPGWIHLTVWGRPALEHSTANGSIGNPGESASTGMLTVGAAHWNDVNTIESYSSQGPLPDGRIKPDVVGAACGATHTYDSLGFTFCGTSQASPHVAGMAALVRQRFPQATTAQVVEYLKENAQQRISNPDPNNTWGHGFAVLPTISPHTVSCTNGTTVPDPANNPDLVRDCETLLSSRDPLRGSGNLNWSGSVPITMWQGILLGRSPRRVRELALGSNNSLTGTIPAELGNLDGLEQLSIINNQLTGTIPAELGNLANLRGLNLNNNQLTGTIPTQLGNLANLRGLDLGNNQLMGTIPSWLGNRVTLVGLNLGNNRLTGTIPTQLGNLSNLQQLYLENNQLEGNLPHSLANLGALQAFDFFLNPGLCAQDDSTIQAWLNRVNYVRGPDCAPTVRLSVTPSHLIEGAGATAVTVTAERAAVSSETRVTLRGGGSAEYGPDFTFSGTGRITIPANASSGTTVLTFTPLADGVIEGDENIILQAVVVENQTEAIEGSAVITLSDEGTSIPCATRDRAALEALYNATGGANWTNNTNWLSSLPLSDWHGVGVDGNGCVAVLTLTDNQLTGSIPAQLGDLASLEGLNLYDNDLTGSIPASLGNLADLLRLDLSGNDLTETIPASLGNLGNLLRLDLSGNDLTETIPASLGNLGNLLTLDLSINDLTGSIPAELGGLGNLQWLNLPHNQLTGSIPAQLGNLASLELLYLDNNQLTGSIPVQLGNLASLEVLWLDNNRLTGSIPVELGNLGSLEELWLDNNRLTGSIPAQLGNLASLEWLYLDNNQLTGTIPQSFTNLGALTRFYFNLNLGLCAQDDSAIRIWLTGVSDILGPDCAPTVRLSVAPSHLIEGAGATAVTVTAKRSAVNSSTNVRLRRGGSAELGPDYTVSGSADITIPANAMSGTTVLTFTPLADGVSEGEENIIIEAVVFENQTEAIEGSAVITLSDAGTSIPCVVARDRAALEALYNATGGANWTNNANWVSSLPLSDWHGVGVDGNGCVTGLDLTDNQLTGTIPSELSNLASLERLWLSENQLTGAIPAELSNLASLEWLSLSFNQLTGTIPTELGNLASLRILVLHDNQLTGSVPVELGNLASLEVLILSDNRLTGTIPVELENLAATLRRLDLDDNQLEGTIPPELGNLANLQELWLDNNRLTGTIPVSLGRLANLRTLRLLGNQLTGAIPAQLGNLASLQWLLLHNNQLTGAIPTELGNLANLRVLLLGNNQLTGTIPSQLGNLANLERLELDDNQLTGTLPDSFTNLGALQEFYFHLNLGLCAQDSGPVRTWLNGVNDVRGPDCSPTVRLSVNPSRLIEGTGATPVTVTAERAAINSDTRVGLRLGGSAEEGAGRDVTVSGSGDIVIPANATTGTTVLTFTPLADGLTEGDEIIILQAVVGNQAEGSAVITLSEPGGLLPTISAATPYSLTVSWDEPAGGPFTDYDVRYRISGSSGAFTDARHAGTARTVILTGLTPDTAYEVQVRATNAMGTGAWSGPVQGRTNPLLPGVSVNVPIYYFPHLAVGAGWQTTITYINYSPQAVTCQTHFISDHGSALPVSFPGLGTIDSRTDVLPPGGSVHEETDVDLRGPLASGWALTACSRPVKASLLFRGYDSQGTPTGEAGVNAAAVPATRFITFAEKAGGKAGTGVAYANPSSSTAIITFTAKDTAGQTLASVNQALLPGGHGAQNMASLFGLSRFTGSLEVTSTEPIVSLALNAEAAPVFSSLPPGEPDANAQGPTTYYFPHLAVGASWQTTITYINYSSAQVTCKTDFISDHGGPLLVSFPGQGMVDSRTDVLPPGGAVHEETDVALSGPLAPGWARATCSEPVKASLLFRQYDSQGEPVAEAGVNAAAAPAKRFVTFAEQAAGKTGTGVAYANPSTSNTASVFFTARNTAGDVLSSVVRTLLPGGHDAQNVVALFGLTSFTGSLEVTSTEPIVSLSLNFEAAPVFSSLPPGEVDP